jgi:hypothetical protein
MTRARASCAFQTCIEPIDPDASRHARGVTTARISFHDRDHRFPSGRGTRILHAHKLRCRARRADRLRDCQIGGLPNSAAHLDGARECELVLSEGRTEKSRHMPAQLSGGWCGLLAARGIVYCDDKARPDRFAGVCGRRPAQPPLAAPKPTIVVPFILALTPFSSKSGQLLEYVRLQEVGDRKAGQVLTLKQ